MIRENKKELILTSFIILIPIIIGVILWNRLPEEIPTHWNSAGEVDGWSSKAFTVFGLPFILLLVQWACVFASSTDPKKKNINGKVLRIAFWICPVISLLFAVLSYGTALGMEFKVDRIMPMLMGIMFIVIGNYLPKCKQSYTMGIKLPWTLNDEENWNRTHRFGGKLWVASGFAMMFSILLPTKAMFVIIIMVLIVTIVATSVYSYLLFKKKERRGE